MITMILLIAFHATATQVRLDFSKGETEVFHEHHDLATIRNNEKTWIQFRKKCTFWKTTHVEGPYETIQAGYFKCPRSTHIFPNRRELFEGLWTAKKRWGNTKVKLVYTKAVDSIPLFVTPKNTSHETDYWFVDYLGGFNQVKYMNPMDYYDRKIEIQFNKKDPTTFSGSFNLNNVDNLAENLSNSIQQSLNFAIDQKRYSYDTIEYLLGVKTDGYNAKAYEKAIILGPCRSEYSKRILMLKLKSVTGKNLQKLTMF